MESRVKQAVELDLSGQCNCAQAIVCTYCDKAGIDRETAYNMACAFGSGLGTGEGTCGSLVGAGIIIGLVSKDRAAARPLIRKIMNEFQARNGATQCKLLKGVGTGKPLCPCDKCIATSAELLEEVLDKEF
ncbi:MAG: C_GCAxxG_C_C family protein [Bacteroidales bacterium]|nr:C_GCAxxG_C_C family protein [Bacteroidales bacterium]